MHDEEDLFPEMPLTHWVEQDDLSPEARPLSGVELWYPGADRSIPMKVKGYYAKRYPLGAVIHSTEGRTKKGDEDAKNTIEYGRDRHCYFCISSTGKVYQPAPLNRWGIHAGRSKWPSMSGDLDPHFAGIEVCCAGVVKKSGNVYKPDWSETFTDLEVRHSEKVENVTKAGYYHRFNDVQERELEKLILWLHKNNPDVFKLENVVGHDEVATNNQGQLGRKQDPGASLSVYMREFRSRLLQKAATS